MRIGARGQVTVPKEIRDRFGLRAKAEVEFQVIKGQIVLRKKPKELKLEKWKGRCKESFARLGYASVDKFVEDVRGR